MKFFKNIPGFKELRKRKEIKEAFAGNLPPETKKEAEKLKRSGIAIIILEICAAIGLTLYAHSKFDNSVQLPIAEWEIPGPKPLIWQTHPDIEKIGEEEAKKKLYEDALKVVQNTVADAFNNDPQLLLDVREKNSPYFENIITADGTLVHTTDKKADIAWNEKGGFVQVKMRPTSNKGTIHIKGIGEKYKNLRYTITYRTKPDQLQLSIGNNENYSKPYPFRKNIGISREFAKSIAATNYTIIAPFEFTIEGMPELFESDVAIVKDI